jgi:hypothetical protein
MTESMPSAGSTNTPMKVGFLIGNTELILISSSLQPRTQAGLGDPRVGACGQLR